MYENHYNPITEHVWTISEESGGLGGQNCKEL